MLSTFIGTHQKKKLHSIVFGPAGAVLVPGWALVGSWLSTGKRQGVGRKGSCRLFSQFN